MLSGFNYYNPIITSLRAGTSKDPYVHRVDTLQINNSTVVLTEIPVQFNKVKVTGEGITWSEIKGVSKENQFRVDYVSGILYFHHSREGLQLTFTYMGRGLIYVPDTMIYTQSDNGQVTQTLNELTEQLNLGLPAIQLATENAIDATNDAIIATGEANTAKNNAITATSNANSATSSANQAADNANYLAMIMSMGGMA